MKKIKKIEILDGQKENPDVLVSFPDILNLISNGDQFCWAILPDYEPSYIKGEAQSISKNIKNEIAANKIGFIHWDEIKILSEGVAQFINLVLIGCKDPKKLKYYQNDDEIFQECEIVIIAFDSSWWEVSCKDEKLMKKFIDTFKEVKIINW